MNLGLVEKVANAVLYEGYILYPYRASAVKNRQRWNFGALYPRAFSEAQGRAAQGVDACVMQTECLVVADEGAAIDVRVRFLHLLSREVGEMVTPSPGLPEGAEPREGTDYRRVEALEVAGQIFQTWQEAVERDFNLSNVVPSELVGSPLKQTFSFPASRRMEPLRDEGGHLAGVIVRRQQPIEGTIELRIADCGSRVEGDDPRQSLIPQPKRLFKVTVLVSNPTPLEDENLQNRDEALMRSLVSTHAILNIRHGEFVSLLDPPETLRDVAASCHNVGTWPVLVGAEGERDCMLSSPIILYDYPQVAPESVGELFDSTEIDEILTLRILTLTDEEKREMRGVDERARRILERTESLLPEQMMKLHGAGRVVRPASEDER